MKKTEILKKLKEIEKEVSALRERLEREEQPKEEQIVGTFDGEFMITDEGKRYQVPPNYASKSMLVPGDTLRLIEEGPQNKFKHIGKVGRKETEGVLLREGEEWIAVCKEGRFKILSASIKHFEADVGDRIKLFIPENYQEIGAEWGAMSGMAEEPPAKVEKPEAGEGKEEEKVDGKVEVEEKKEKVKEDVELR